jgi:hypothetical protein
MFLAYRMLVSYDVMRVPAAAMEREGLASFAFEHVCVSSLLRVSWRFTDYGVLPTLFSQR